MKNIFLISITLHLLTSCLFPTQSTDSAPEPIPPTQNPQRLRNLAGTI